MILLPAPSHPKPPSSKWCQNITKGKEEGYGQVANSVSCCIDQSETIPRIARMSTNWMKPHQILTVGKLRLWHAGYTQTQEEIGTTRHSLSTDQLNARLHTAYYIGVAHCLLRNACHTSGTPDQDDCIFRTKSIYFVTHAWRWSFHTPTFMHLHKIKKKIDL